MGIPDHLICLLRNLCAGQEATVRTGHGTTDWFQIRKGVRQGCILSPCLFNLYAVSEKMVDKSNLKQKMVDKWSIKPSLAEKLADILGFVADKAEITTETIVVHFGFSATSAKRYLRQLVEFGYLEARGGNKNRTYIRRLESSGDVPASKSKH